MSVKVANSRFIVSSLKRYAGFYQQLLSSVSDFQEFGSKLVYAIEAANSLRQSDRVEELGLVLVNSPIREYQLIGKYYGSVAAYRKGESERAVFEEVIEKSRTYKARGLISLAAVEASSGDLDSGLKLYAEAMRYAETPSVFLRVARSIAIIKSMEGYRKQALKDLERLTPLTRYANPVVYHNHLNSLAVELIEAGRIEEATNISRIVLASPYAFAYPEWRETWQELALRGYRSRSSIPVIQSFFKPEKIQNEKIQNVLHLPERNTAPVRLRTKPAKVLSYVDWKEKMDKEEKDEIPPDADEGDLYLRLMEMIALKDLNAWELRQVIDFVEKLRPKEGKN